MKKFIVLQPDNLKDFTDKTYPQGSFCYNVLLKNKDIKVNGQKVRENVELQVGDEVCYYTTKKQEEKLTHYLVFEDENVIIADKFCGVSTEGLSSELYSTRKCELVHRLDRNTCGLICFAKNDVAEKELTAAFRDRDVKKTYLAICKNKFKKNHEYLKAFLKKDAKKSIVKISDAPTSGYVPISTEYTVMKRSGEYALVEVQLHTGKTHQIRAHLAHVGCPVLGDEKYGDEALNKKYGVKRQLLVAKYLTFNFDGKLSYLNGKTFASSFMPEIG